VTRRFAVAATALVLLSGTLSAQGDSLRRAARSQILPGGKPGARLNPGGVAAKDQANLPVRQQVRQAFQARIRDELNLDQPKMRRLNQTEQSFNRQRSEVGQSERQTRLALAAAMQDSTPDQGKIDGLINQLIQAQRKRADLLEAEQKELSSFLTPMQRAQYLSLTQQLQARMRELTQAGRGVPPGAPPPQPPPER
jgi:hypothetical protein